MYVQQVLALLLYPRLLDDPSLPQDAKNRAKRILNDTMGQTISTFYRIPFITDPYILYPSVLTITQLVLL